MAATRPNEAAKRWLLAIKGEPLFFSDGCAPFSSITKWKQKYCEPMKIKLSDLWRWDGTIDRGPFFFWGVLLFVVKFNVDRLASWLLFGRSWSIFDYQRAGEFIWRTLPPREDGVYYSTLIALALPFLWAGVVLTLGRLRSAGLPLWLVLLFFAPVIKLVFFAVLCILPSKQERLDQRLAPGDIKGIVGLIIPRNRAGSAVMGIFLTLLLAIAATWLSAKVLREYGWSLFVGLPFIMGFLSVLIYSYHQPQSLGSCLKIASSTILLAGVGLLLVAFEGLICLIMAAPLAIGIGLAGGAVAYVIQSKSWWYGNSGHLFCVVVLAAPVSMGIEGVQTRPPPLLEVKTALEVNAPPEKVWNNVVAFSELPPPREWLFLLGIAYPVRAEIHGAGAGAVRHCNFSTGPFVEPIEVWDAPRLLKFSVTTNPAPMQEWTPFKDIHPPHLDGFLESRGGQFYLVPLPDGRTRLEGTTWYHHRMWPVRYWQMWSDFIIHRIHLRVLRHAKQLSEKE